MVVPLSFLMDERERAGEGGGRKEEGCESKAEEKESKLSVGCRPLLKTPWHRRAVL